MRLLVRRRSLIKHFFFLWDFSYTIQQLIMLTYKDHPHVNKWDACFRGRTIDWGGVWEAVNGLVSLECTKTIIWEQIHLNEYTTYSYNKWHNAQQVCPFCQEIPDTRFHITLECPVVQSLWSEVGFHWETFTMPRCLLWKWSLACLVIRLVLFYATGLPSCWEVVLLTRRMLPFTIRGIRVTPLRLNWNLTIVWRQRSGKSTTSMTVLGDLSTSCRYLATMTIW